MHSIKYTDSAQFQCLENLRKTSLDMYLIHAGWEYCLPSHHNPGKKDEYIIHFILSGKGTYTSGSRTWHLSEKQMFLIYPDEYVTYTADSEDPWHYTWIGFNGIRTNAILKNCGFSKKNLVQTYNCTDNILELVRHILASRHLSFSNDLRRQSYLMLLFANLCDNYSSQNPKRPFERIDTRSNTYVENALDYIKYSYQDGINVTDISDYIGISRTYLNHVFKKRMGISVQDYLINYRLQRAANLLISTGMTVKEIAKSIGYEDPLAFSKAFKKKFEISPKSYRTHKDKIEKFTEKQPWES